MMTSPLSNITSSSTCTASRRISSEREAKAEIDRSSWSRSPNSLSSCELTIPLARSSGEDCINSLSLCLACLWETRSLWICRAMLIPAQVLYFDGEQVQMQGPSAEEGMGSLQPPVAQSLESASVRPPATGCSAGCVEVAETVAASLPAVDTEQPAAEAQQRPQQKAQQRETTHTTHNTQHAQRERERTVVVQFREENQTRRTLAGPNTY